MKKVNSLSLNIFISFVFFISLFLLFFIPVTMNKNVWSSYRLLFLPMNANTTEILEFAEADGLAGIISIDCIDNRFKDIDNAIYSNPYFTEKDRYRQWFINEQENIQYMYIPKNQKISSAFFSFLKRNTEFFYIEDNNQFSLFQLIISSLFFLVAFAHTKRKSIYFAFSFPFVIFASFQPGILALSSSLLMAYSIAFWVEAVGYYLKFTREQLLKRIKKNPLLIFLPIVAIVIASFNSSVSFWLFLLAILCGISCTYISEKVKFFINKKLDEGKIHKKITPYAMNPKSIESFWETKKLFIVSASVVILIVFSSLFLFFKFSKTMQAYKNIVFLPMPAKSVEQGGISIEILNKLEKIRSGDALPDLGDFILDEWNLKIMPYRKLNIEQDQPIIKFSDFSLEQNGIVKQNNSIVFKFDDEFIQRVISFRPSPSIEDLLYSEGICLSAAYSSKTFPLNRFNFAAFLVALLSGVMPVIIILMRVFDK